MTSLSPASQWIYKKFIELEEALQKNLDNYTLGHSIDALYKYLWDSYADWYVEYLKTDESQKEFARELLSQYIVTLHPYMPFETEVLWKEFVGGEKLLAQTQKDQDFVSKYEIDEDAVSEFEKVVGIVLDLRSLRGLFAIDPGTKMEVTTDSQILRKYEKFFSLVAKSEILVGDVTGYKLSQNGLTIGVDIKKYVIDVETEIARTKKQIDSLSKQVSALEGRLGNDKFISGAAPEIIEEARGNLRQRQMDIKKQEEKLEILQ